MRRDEARRALYLDASAVAVRRDGPSLLVQRPGRASQRIPLRRIQRAVVRGVNEPLLDALLALAAAGSSVHFEDSQGYVHAVLQPARQAAGREARELAAIIAHSSGVGAFNVWREIQLRHAVSLAFREGFRGDIRAARLRLLRYLRYFQPGAAIEFEVKMLSEQLRGWLQAELSRQGFHPVIRELALKGCDVVDVLEQCLGVTLLWVYVRWRRQLSGTVERRDLIGLFELQAAGPLLDQLYRHLAALADEFQARQRRRRSLEWEEELADAPDDKARLASMIREEWPL